MTKRGRNGARSEAGATLVELLTTIAILTVVLGVAASTLGSAQKTQNVGQSESAAVDVARIASEQIERDIRSALTVGTCSPTGYCLELYAQVPNGTVDQIRYRATQSSPPSGPTTLYRDSSCNAGYTTCSVTRTMIGNLANHKSSTAVLSCVGATTFPHVNIVLLVTPLSAYNTGALTVQSTARPRNVTTAFC